MIEITRKRYRSELFLIFSIFSLPREKDRGAPERVIAAFLTILSLLDLCHKFGGDFRAATVSINADCENFP